LTNRIFFVLFILKIICSYWTELTIRLNIFIEHGLTSYGMNIIIERHLSLFLKKICCKSFFSVSLIRNNILISWRCSNTVSSIVLFCLFLAIQLYWSISFIMNNVLILKRCKLEQNWLYLDKNKNKANIRIK
jgi:hypothetical protein